MKQSLESSETRQALLDAARQLFAEHGYEGASVRAITSAAEVNLGAVTYHFGTKEALYDAVIGETLDPMVDDLVAAAGGGGWPLDRVEAVVRTYFDYITNHPELPRLLLHSVLASGMPPAAAMGRLQRVSAALTALIQEGQAAGVIRPGPAPVMGLGLISQAIHLSVMRVPLAVMGKVDLADPAVREVLADNLVQFARRGIAAGPESS